MDKLKKKGQNIKLFFRTDWNVVRARSLAVVTTVAFNLVIVQVPTLLGLNGIPSIVAAIPPAVIQNIGNISLRTLAISISAIVFLAVLRKASKKLGENKTVAGRAARVGFNMSSLLVVLIFTIVSFLFLQNLPITQQVVPAVSSTMGGATAAATASGANASATSTSTTAAQTVIPAKRDELQFVRGIEFPSANIGSGLQRRSEPQTNSQSSNASAAAATGASGGSAKQTMPKLPFWAVFPGFTSSIVSPLPPIFDVVKSLFLPSLLVFISLNIEHLAIAKTFGHYHTYTISQNSEMFAAGLSNLAGAFFGGMPVGGGDMARSSVLAVAGAKSPLSQIFTSVTVLLVMMPLSGALRFLPQAALSAIIAIALIDQQPPQKLLGDYFRLSFADFLAFFMAFNIAIAVSTLGVVVGTAVGLGILVLYTLFRVMFSRPRAVSALDLESMYKEREVTPWQQGDPIPPGTQVLKLETDMVWTNADRIRRHVVDTCMIHNSGVAVDSIDTPERPWNFQIHEHVAKLRREHSVIAGSEDDSDSLIQHRPRLRVVVLDMTSTSFIDSSAILNLEMMKRQLREWAGESVEFRFVGLNARVLKRFERAQWQIVDPCGPRVVEEGEEYKTVDLRFDHLPLAIHYMNPEMTLNGMWEEVAVVMGEDINKIDKAYV
ncbi:putative sulfate permease [Diaporthe ampelina]|uniref:Putative sulfate permease n=1 Tax=Diaporthe ampelina TaxID=1214573 RepID=A0A0G2FAI9_9PEZI|nr:putative sulfate permease [Diaporthe ampelina]